MRPSPPGALPGVASPSPATEAITTTCPFCKSDRVTTTSKTISPATYWRCHGCGEIWNPSRAQSAPPFNRHRW